MADERISIAIEAINRASKELQAVEKDMLNLDKTASKTEKGMDGFSKKLSSISGDFSKVGAAMTVGLTVPLTALGKTMIDQVGNIEQFKVAFDVMLGSAEEGSRVLKEVADFAAKTPFDLPGVVASSKQLLALGVETDRLLPTLKSIGDVAAGTGAELQRLILNFGQVKTQGKLTGRELRDFAVNGVPLIDELAKQFGVAKDEIQDMVSAGEVGFDAVERAFTSMSSEGGRFFDLMDRQSKTLKGILSNMRDNFVRVSLAVLGFSTEAENFGEIVEGGPFDILKTQAEKLLGSMDDLVVRLQGMSAETKTTIVSVLAFVAALGPLALLIAGITGAMAAFSSTVGLVVLGVTALGAILIRFKDSIIAPITLAITAFGIALAGLNRIMAISAVASINFTRAFVAMRTAVTLAGGVLPALAAGIAGLINPVTLVAGVIGGVVFAMVRASQKAKELREATEELDNALRNFGGDTVAFDRITAAFNEAVAKVEEATDKVNSTMFGVDQEESNQALLDQRQSVEELRDSVVSMLEAYGAAPEKIKEVTDELKFFNKIVEPTVKDKRLLKEVTEELSLTFEVEAAAFSRTVDTYRKGSVDIETAVSLAVDQMKKEWTQAGKDADLLSEAVVDNFVARIGEMESVGEAYSVGISEGMTATRVTNVLRRSGIKVSDEALGQLLAKAVEAKDIGEVYGLLLGVGLDKSEAEVASKSGNLAEAVSTALASHKDQVRQNAQELGNSLTSGIESGLRERFGPLGKLLGSIAKALSFLPGINLPGLGALFGDTQKTIDSFNKALEELENGGGGGGGGGGESPLKKRLDKITDAQTDFLSDFRNFQLQLQNIPGADLFDLGEIEPGLSSVDGILNEVSNTYNDIKDNINDIIDAHQTFIDEAQTGLNEYEQKLKDINSEYEDLQEQLAADTAQEVGEALTDALSDQQKLQEDIKELQEDLAEAEGEQKQEIQDRIDLLKEELSTRNQLISDVNEIVGEENVQAHSKALEARQEELIALGKTVLLQDKSNALAKEYAEFQAKQNLSELEFILYKAGLESEQLKKKKEEEIKNLNDLKTIQEQIVSGDIATADLQSFRDQGFSEENIAVAEAAQREVLAYQSKLQAQLDLLETFKSDELAIYDETYSAIEGGQASLETYLEGSYNRIINKLGEVRKAAEEAFKAQQKVSGGGGDSGGSVPGGFKGGFFANGGFTSPGNIRDIAGVVHKGEWVAPNWMVRNFRPLFNMLEDVRNNRAAGFMEGGHVGGDTVYQQPITMHNNITSQADFDTVARQIAWRLRTS